MALAAPFKPAGIGQVAAQNVFKVTFSQALSTNPKLQAWDDYNMDSVTNKIFVGTTVNGDKSMIGGIGLTSAPSASWFPSTETAGSAVNTATLLRGNNGFALLSGSAPGAGDSVYFNIDYKIPSDLVPADNVAHVIGIEYQYTGAVPNVTWAANKGTEGTPDWDTLTHGMKGSAPVANDTEIAPCDTGEGNDGTGTYKLTIPSSGQIFPDEIWLKNYAG